MDFLKKRSSQFEVPAGYSGREGDVGGEGDARGEGGGLPGLKLGTVAAALTPRPEWTKGVS
jgi:hypothetical protein